MTTIATIAALVASIACSGSDDDGVLFIGWWTVDGGGGRSSGGAQTSVIGTMAQCDAVTSTGGGFVLRGGFWPGVGTIFDPPVSCPLDLDDDGVIAGGDLGILLASWGVCDPPCPNDVNADGVVDGADLGLLLGAWGPCPK